MHTATFTQAEVFRTLELNERTEPPRPLPARLHSVLWFVEIEIQRTGLPPSLHSVCEAFGVTTRVTREMLRSLRDRGYVSITSGDRLFIRFVTLEGTCYCCFYPPA